MLVATPAQRFVTLQMHLRKRLYSILSVLYAPKGERLIANQTKLTQKFTYNTISQQVLVCASPCHLYIVPSHFAAKSCGCDLLVGKCSVQYHVKFAEYNVYYNTTDITDLDGCCQACNDDSSRCVAFDYEYFSQGGSSFSLLDSFSPTAYNYQPIWTTVGVVSRA